MPPRWCAGVTRTRKSSTWPHTPAQPHVLVYRRGRLTDPVDAILAQHDLRRRVLATVGTTATAAHLIARSDAVLTAPELTWRPLADAFGLVTVPLPVTLPAPPVICGWHQRYETDPAQAWLRDRVRTAFADVLPA